MEKERAEKWDALNKQRDLEARLAVAQNELLRTKAGFSDFKARIPAIEEEAWQEREAQIMANVVPQKIEDALTLFQASPMQKELQSAYGSAVKEFKSVSFPVLLQEEFDKGFMSFAASDKGDEYIQGECCRGLMEYRSAMIHYNPIVNPKEIDKHFPVIFGYAVMKGEVLPEVPEHRFPDPLEDEDERDSPA